jgi:hypothetical protein
VFLVFAANGASAGFVAVGTPVDGNSWSQGFIESGVGSFDFMAVEMVSAGDTFVDPAFSSLASGWTQAQNPADTWSYASGTSTTSMTFNIRFEGSSSDPLEFNFYAFGGSTLLEAANAKWNGSSWSISTFSTTLTRSDIVAIVPVPSAAGLGLAMLGALGAIGVCRRRLRRK